MFNKRKKTLDEKKFNKVIIIIFFAILLLAMLRFINIYFSRNIQSVGIEQLNSYHQEVENILLDLESELIPDTAYFVKLEVALYEGSYILDDPTNSEELYNYNKACSDILRNIEKGYLYNTDIRSVYIMLEDADAPYVIVNGNILKKDAMFDVEWRQTCYDKCKDTYINWREAKLYYSKTVNVISVYKKILSTSWIDDRLINGYMVINYSMDDVLNKIKLLTEADECLILYNKEENQFNIIGKNPISVNDMNFILEKMDNLQNTQGSFVGEDDRKLLYSGQELVSGFYSIAVKEDQIINELINKLFLISLCVIVLFLIIIIVFYIISYKQYKAYILGLVNIIETVDRSNLGNQDKRLIKMTSLVEGGGVNFKVIVDKILSNEINISELMDTIMSEKGLRAEVELLYGHSQINSHFLLNSMDYIYWSSIRNNGFNNTGSIIIEKLCIILKYALDSSDLFTVLEEEVENARTYQEIQQIFKEVELDVLWDIPEYLMSAKVEKLILQPVLENCIQHGMVDSNKKSMKIVIKVMVEDNVLIINISDDGIGLTQSRIDELNKRFKSNKPVRSRHIGLANINRRIQIQYGNEYGVSLDQSEMDGLKVEMKLKYIDND